MSFERSSHPLTPAERLLARAIGVVMFGMSLGTLAVAVLLYLPFARLIEGLSK